VIGEYYIKESSIPSRIDIGKSELTAMSAVSNRVELLWGRQVVGFIGRLLVIEIQC
jgi:hypothetical protein